MPHLQQNNTYDALGNLTGETDALGDTVTQPNGETVSYTYDSHGNRATMTYPNGKKVTYTYDAMNRLVSVKGVDGKTTRYSYDALGRRIATEGAKETSSYTYDEVGNLVSQTTTGAYDLALEYAYDLSGRMTSESRTENGATLTSVFTYDPLGQLTSFTRSDGLSESYAYDPVGNMTAKTQNGVSTAMRYNAANQLISSVTGNDTTKYTYDANGNLTRSENAAGARSYAYNALNLLESFTREDGYSETYTYNTNRLLSEIRTSEDLTTTLTWDILYGDGVVISADQNGQTTNYTYGLERISAKTGSTRTEYVYDGRGSVAAEVSYNNAWYTFGGGLARKNVVSKSYSPFGELLTEQTSGFGYNGEYYNAATGMIYLRARFYEPEMNRFGQKDLLRGSAFAPQSLNRYLYVQNDPINFVDSNGRDLKSAWNTVKGAVVGAVKGAVTGATIGAAVGGVVGGIVGAVAGAVAGGIAGAISSKAQPSQPVNNTPPKTPANKNKLRASLDETTDSSADTQAKNDSLPMSKRGTIPQTPGIARETPSVDSRDNGSQYSCKKGVFVTDSDVVYILYTSLKGNESDFSIQANYLKAQLEANGKTVVLYDAVDNLTFRQGWESIPYSAEEVYILSHSSGNSIITVSPDEHDPSLVSEGYSIDGKNAAGVTDALPKISSLPDKEFGRIVLYACNGGHLDKASTQDGNIAQSFNSFANVVIAYDGNIAFGPFAGKNDFLPKIFNNYEPRLSGNQASFYSLVESYSENGNTRSPEGWVVYSTGESPMILHNGKTALDVTFDCFAELFVNSTPLPPVINLGG